MPDSRIMVVDDDPTVRELINDYLSNQGYEVQEADSASAARTQLEDFVPHVVLLDIGLPGEDGLSLARHLREHHDLGIIMVSGAGDTMDRIIGLEVGADDYVSKPFDPRELHARVKSVVRRYQNSSSTTNASLTPDKPELLHIGPFSLDLNSRRLLNQKNDEITLTTMEFELLRIFAERPNRALSRDQILDLTQNRDWDPYDRSIDIRIARLRKKLEPDTDKPQMIRTVRGVGYMYVPPGN